jgi:hypothetical protein
MNAMWAKQFHKPSPSHQPFLGGMFTIPSHGWFMIVLPTVSGWWFQTFFSFHNIWYHPSQ